MAMMRCPEINPQGQQCNLAAGHAGVHQVASEWGPQAPRSTHPTAGGAMKQGFGWAMGCLFFIIALLVVFFVIGALGQAGSR